MVQLFQNIAVAAAAGADDDDNDNKINMVKSVAGTGSAAVK